MGWQSRCRGRCMSGIVHVLRRDNLACSLYQLVLLAAHFFCGRGRYARLLTGVYFVSLSAIPFPFRHSNLPRYSVSFEISARAWTCFWCIVWEERGTGVCMYLGGCLNGKLLDFRCNSRPLPISLTKLTLSSRSPIGADSSIQLPRTSKTWVRALTITKRLSAVHVSERKGKVSLSPED